MTVAGRRHRLRTLAVDLAVVAVLLWTVGPLFALFADALGFGPALDGPIDGRTTLAAAATLAGDDRLVAALGDSLVVAFAVAAIALPLGLAGALLLDRRRSPASGPLFAGLIVPLLVPGIVVGLADLILGHRLGLGRGPLTVVLAEAARLAVPVTILVLVRLRRLDHHLIDVARDLGASRPLIAATVLGPHLAPTLAFAAGLVVLLSLIEIDTAALVSGPTTLLSGEIAARLRLGFATELDLFALLILGIVGLAAIAARLVLRRRPPQ